MFKLFKKLIKVVLCIVIVVVLVFSTAAILLTYCPGQQADSSTITNQYIVDEALISAHRVGSSLAPENTLMALKQCVEEVDFTIDILEFDLQLTKDGVLILLHDSSLDRTTNSAEQFGIEGLTAADLTYDELMLLNFGENYEDKNGNYPYRGLCGEDIPEDLHVLSLEQALDYVEANGDFKYIIEIKNEGETGYVAADKLYSALAERNIVDKVIFGTFNIEVSRYMDENYPDLMRSAGVSEMVVYYLAAAFNIDLPESFYKFEALQIPTSQYMIILGSERLINYSHRHNIAVQYWTINDADEMARLSQIGADCIITDYPDIAYSIIYDD